MLVCCLTAAPASAGLFDAKSYGACLLAELPNVGNDLVARHAISKCLQRFPDGMSAVQPNHALPAKYPDGRACLIANAKDTKSPVAAQMLQFACFKLYGAPKGTSQYAAGFEDLIPNSPDVSQGRTAPTLRPYDGPVVIDVQSGKDDFESNVEYAVAAATFSAAIAYCHGKYGPINSRSRGGQCFESAKKILAKAETHSAINEAKKVCRQAVLRTCITPELGKVVARVLTLFEGERL